MKDVQDFSQLNQNNDHYFVIVVQQKFALLLSLNDKTADRYLNLQTLKHRLQHPSKKHSTCVKSTEIYQPKSF